LVLNFIKIEIKNKKSFSNNPYLFRKQTKYNIKLK